MAADIYVHIYFGKYHTARKRERVGERERDIDYYCFKLASMSWAKELIARLFGRNTHNKSINNSRPGVCVCVYVCVRHVA